MTAMQTLTLDNPPLSEVTTCPVMPPGSVQVLANLELDLDARVTTLIGGSVSANTREAYRSDLEHYLGWGGGIPSSPETLARYLAAHAGALSVATLVRRLASIAKAHRAAEFASPTSNEVVRATLRGIKRTYGTAQRQAAPLLRDDLGTIIDRMGMSVKDARDRALLLIGFAGALRRSELVALDVADIENVRQGIVLHIRRSKTDQEGRGKKIGIPFGRTRWCPVAALDSWLTRAGISEGPIFRLVDRHGHVHDARLSSEAVSCTVKKRAAAAGFDPTGYSGHSLRAGLVTSAAQAGIASWKIRRQSRHASDAMLAKYIRSGELFIDNAAGALL